MVTGASPGRCESPTSSQWVSLGRLKYSRPCDPLAADNLCQHGKQGLDSKHTASRPECYTAPPDILHALCADITTQTRSLRPLLERPSSTCCMHCSLWQTSPTTFSQLVSRFQLPSARRRGAHTSSQPQLPPQAEPTRNPHLEGTQPDTSPALPKPQSQFQAVSLSPKKEDLHHLATAETSASKPSSHQE